MNTTECDRETDVLEAILSERWPTGAADTPRDQKTRELYSHAAACPTCADLAAVAAGLRTERDAAWSEAHVPTSGQVWWRATMRARSEAVAAAARPLTILQALAGACGAGVCAAIITLAGPWALEPLGRVVSGTLEEVQRMAAVIGSPAVTQHALLSLAALLVAGVILSPLILYLVLSDE
jgi:hypothetical protein